MILLANYRKRVMFRSQNVNKNPDGCKYSKTCSHVGSNKYGINLILGDQNVDFFDRFVVTRACSNFYQLLSGQLLEDCYG